MIGTFFSPIVGSNKINEKTNDFLNSKDGKDIDALSAPSWPTTWILVDTDPGEDGTSDDYRDVHYVYFNTDPDYIYLRQECYGPAGWTYGNARYKFWFDLDCNAYISGGNLIEGEFLFFVEDINDDNIGEIYLLEDLDNDGMFSEWEGPPDYYSSGLITDSNIAGYQIVGNCVDLYLDLDEIVNPYDGCIVWATDQENPNLDQAPNTDRPEDDDIPFPLLNPSILLDKQASTHLVNVGETITYTFNVTNNGDFTLTSVTVVDNMLGPIILGTTTLNPGESTQGTATYTVTAGDLPGPIVNTAIATGTDPTGDPVNNIDSEYVVIQYGPNISLNKQANVNTANIGDTITYTYTVTNTGDVILTWITVMDDVLGSITLGTTTLSPGQTTQGTATHTVVEGDLPGPIVNNATATGTPPVGSNVTNTDTETVSLNYTACIHIVKQANVHTASVGQTITYTYNVTNCGSVTLTGVTVVDDILGSISLGTTTLAPGGSTTGTATYTVVNVDLPGPIVNIATATGTPPTGGTVTDTDTETVTITYTAYINIDKQANVATATIGQTITYTYTVTNCGDVTLTGVTVVDDKLGSITLGTTTLSPGQTTQGTATHTVTAGDLPGPIVNTATATGATPTGGTVTDTDTTSVSLTYNPCINIDKQANVATATIGQTITYTYTITNCGDVTITGITVTDNKIGTITPGTTTLSPGQTTQGTKSIIVTCEHYPILINNVIATGIDPTGSTIADQDSETVNIVINPSITIEKMVYNPITHQWANCLTLFSGIDINFKITVKNNGDNVLNNVKVIDYLPSYLVYNYDATPSADIESDHQIQWNIGTLNINQQVTLYFSAYAEDEGYSNNIANASGDSCITVYDQSETPINVYPCQEEVWIDDNWHGQSDVNQYNPSLLWGINAFNNIQQGVDVLCNCGTVHVRPGLYVEQIIINKDMQMLGENKPRINLPGNANSYTIHGSTESWIPIILAYGGTLVGNDITGTGNIAVKIDGFEFNGADIPGSVDILYHNVESGCVPAIISNNTITKGDIGIKIDGCTDDTTIIHNIITWDKSTSGKIGIIITSSGGCMPYNVEIHYNYLGAPCGLNIGIWNQVSIIVDADLNWWGEDDGPGSPKSGYTYDAITGRIANGLGDDVIGLVHFDPWWGVDASATVHPLDVTVGQPVYYDASASFAYDENGAIDPADIQYYWKFDDGIYSFSKQGVHIYNSPGTYDIILRIMVLDYYIQGVCGFLMDFAYFTVHVSPAMAPLSANADSRNLKGYDGTINNPVQFYGSAQGGEPPYTYKWDLGDGSISNENNPIHIYEDVKEYNVILTVTDNTGDTAQDNTIVTIYKDKLTANAGGPYIGNAGEEILFKGEATGGLQPYYYIWDFCYGRNIVQEQNPTYTFYQEGTYIIKLLVIDSKGNIDEDIVEVQIIKNDYSPVEIKQVTGGIRIKATIAAGDNDCNWAINVACNFMLLGGEASGTIIANTEETVKLPLTIALGKTTVTVTAGNIKKQYTAFALGPFFLNLQQA